METDLHNVIKKGTVLEDVHRRYIMYQMFRATKYLHTGSVIHRDLKPSNILIDSDCRVKVADFGLARSVGPAAGLDRPGDPTLTNYVATRWYRAPEILLNSRRYTLGVDMWSLGCILAEMLLGRPLFPGSSTLDQIERIMAVIEPPSREDLLQIPAQYVNTILTKAQQDEAPDEGPAPHVPQLRDLLAGAPTEAVDLVEKLLVFNPDKRLTAEQALRHPFVAKFHNADHEPSMDRAVVPCIRDDVQLSVEVYRNKLYELIASRKNRVRNHVARVAQHKQNNNLKDDRNSKNEKIDRDSRIMTTHSNGVVRQRSSSKIEAIHYGHNRNRNDDPLTRNQTDGGGNGHEYHEGTRGGRVRSSSVSTPLQRSYSVTRGHPLEDGLQASGMSQSYCNGVSGSNLKNSDREVSPIRALQNGSPPDLRCNGHVSNQNHSQGNHKGSNVNSQARHEVSPATSNPNSADMNQNSANIKYSSSSGSAMKVRVIARTIDHGRGSTDNGRGSTDHGRGSTDHGRGSTDHGRGSTDHGRGSTDNGRGSTDHGRGSTDSGKGSKSLENRCPQKAHSVGRNRESTSSSSNNNHHPHQRREEAGADEGRPKDRSSPEKQTPTCNSGKSWSSGGSGGRPSDLSRGRREGSSKDQPSSVAVASCGGVTVTVAQNSSCQLPRSSSNRTIHGTDTCSDTSPTMTRNDVPSKSGVISCNSRSGYEVTNQWDQRSSGSVIYHSKPDKPRPDSVVVVHNRRRSTGLDYDSFIYAANKSPSKTAAHSPTSPISPSRKFQGLSVDDKAHFVEPKHQPVPPSDHSRLAPHGQETTTFLSHSRHDKRWSLDHHRNPQMKASHGSPYDVNNDHHYPSTSDTTATTICVPSTSVATSCDVLGAPGYSRTPSTLLPASAVRHQMTAAQRRGVAQASPPRRRSTSRSPSSVDLPDVVDVHGVTSISGRSIPAFRGQSIPVFDGRFFSVIDVRLRKAGARRPVYHVLSTKLVSVPSKKRLREVFRVRLEHGQPALRFSQEKSITQHSW
ncbi:uncharacterized protein LOC108680148 isoform X2 [Hyalella azteca]|nr:uncharacterized protein LOC108680148 isoform X2 [Hyalella azteca]